VTGFDRRALAKAITQSESQRPEDRAAAVEALNAALARTGKAARVGISGPPGVGKSSLLEVLGLVLADEGHRVAVLAVDPSSTRSGGSILGDKTRMAELSRHPNAFVRPSPSRGDLGGITRRTNEAVLLCEAAGFDHVFVETVGVGQSEVAVVDVVDTFVLLVGPGGGDDLQGVKRGITEHADVIVATKADGDLSAAARRTAADYTAAMRLLRPRWATWERRAIAVSALDGVGIDQLRAAIAAHRTAIEETGELDALRRAQRQRWLDAEIRDAAVRRLLAETSARDTLDRLRDDVLAGVTVPSAAALLV
jgi:LAO/AO transport system kinase